MKVNKNILLIILITVTILTLLFIINLDRDRTESVSKPTLIQIEDKEVQDKPASNFTIFVSKEVCEGCHISGKSFIPQALTVEPHANGGAYCLICHKIDHESHPMDGNVTCEKCHGSSPTKPSYINGSITCNICHNYPDPLTPSGGNIITIHKPRGISCNNCHTDQCIRCHPDGGGGPKWEKRLTHFRTIMKTL